MNVSLTPELDDFVQKSVAGGRYASASEVVRHGLRLLADLEEEREAKRTSIRAWVREALDDPDPSLSQQDVEDHSEAYLAKLLAKKSP